MKKLKKGLFLILILMFFKLNFSSTLLFSMKDNRGDDYGNRNYVYPLSPEWEEQELDLTKVQIFNDGKNYKFVFKFAKRVKTKNQIQEDFPDSEDVQNYVFPYYSWDFVHIGIDVYIHYKDEENLFDKPIIGRKTKLSKKWNKVLFVCPIDRDYFDNYLRDKNDVKYLNKIKNSILLADYIDINSNTIVAYVSKDEMGKLEKGKFQIAVLVFQYDGYQSERRYLFNAEILPSPTQDRFGGRVREDEPNVIDILDTGEQIEALSGYSGVRFYPLDKVAVKKVIKVKAKPKDVNIDKQLEKKILNSNFSADKSKKKVSKQILKINKNLPKLSKKELEAKAIVILNAIEIYRTLYPDDRNVTVTKLIKEGLIRKDEILKKAKIIYDYKNDKLTLIYGGEKVEIGGNR